MPSFESDILLLESIHPAADGVLVDDGLRIDRVDGSLEGADLVERLGTTRMLGIRSKTRMTREVIEQATHLQAIGCFCIGTNQVDLDAAADHGITVFNSPFSNTRSVAEMTLAEIISLHRRLFDRSMRLHQGQWDKSATAAHEVRGRTLGIVGYGHIGSQISVLAESLGMRVVFHDTLPVMPMGNARACKTLDELLEMSDVVTIHVPETDSTRNLIGTAQLDRMKPSAALINNARGSVVDLDALRAALGSLDLIRSGRRGVSCEHWLGRRCASKRCSCCRSLVCYGRGAGRDHPGAADIHAGALGRRSGS